jgi:hypothetical protein
MVAYQSEERVTYQTLKEWALDSYFNFCRDSGLADRRGHEQVMARLDYTFEGGFERPVEDLMWRVILLVLSSGLHSDWEVQQRKLIADRIADHGLDVASRTIIWSLVKQVRVRLIPLFHGLHRRTALER